MEHTDHHVGRIFDTLKDLGVYDDTLIYIIIGDNGASAEGTLQGAFNEMANFNGMGALETPEFMASKTRRIRFASVLRPLRGRLGLGDGHALPVDQAGRLALGRHPQRDHRPLPQADQGQGRRPQPVQPCHRCCADGARGRRACPSRRSSTGFSRARTRGRAWLYSFADAKAPERHDLQYFEMFGNRGIYYQGWSAVTKHKTPWIMVGQASPAFDDDVWELYDGNKDWTQAHDLRRRTPEQAPRAAASVAHRGHPLQRAAARRPGDRACHP